MSHFVVMHSGGENKSKHVAQLTLCPESVMPTMYDISTTHWVSGSGLSTIEIAVVVTLPD